MNAKKQLTPEEVSLPEGMFTTFAKACCGGSREDRHRFKLRTAIAWVLNNKCSPLLNSEAKMLTLLERILDSKFEADKWAHEAELFYIKLGGQKQSLIAPTLRGRIEARKQEAETR